MGFSMHLKCPCSAAAKSTSSNVGEAMDQTGFTPIFTYEGLIWLCGTCTPKVKAALAVLWPLLGRHPYALVPALRELAEEAEREQIKKT